MNAVASPEAIERVEEIMLAMPQVACNVRHIFAPGLYLRELTMAAGTVAIGHGQRRAQVNIFLRGAVRILNGDRSIELRAPLTYVGAAGRKIGIVLEDIVWLNVYPNPSDERDIDKLEAEHLVKTETIARMNRELLPDLRARADFEALVLEAGRDTDSVRQESERTDDLCDFPPGPYCVKVGASAIEGRGLIATADMAPGDIICPATHAGKRTPAGRFTNHSDRPNALPMRFTDGEIYWMAIAPIEGSRGGFDGAEITIDYREVRALHAGGSS